MTDGTDIPSRLAALESKVSALEAAANTASASGIGAEISAKVESLISRFDTLINTHFASLFTSDHAGVGSKAPAPAATADPVAKA